MSIHLNIKSGKFLKGSDFIIPGLMLKITSEPKEGKHPKFLDPNTGEPREGWFYKFEDKERNSKEMFSGSSRLALAFNSANVNVGDWILIYKEGEGFQTKYYVVKQNPVDTLASKIASGFSPPVPPMVESEVDNSPIDSSELPF